MLKVSNLELISHRIIDKRAVFTFFPRVNYKTDLYVVNY